MFKHLLVPLDGSKFAEIALDYALSLAQSYDSQITLLQVVPGPWKAEMKAELPNMDDLAQDVKTATATNYLEEMEHRLGAEGYAVTAVIMRGQSIPEAIIDTAEHETVDTIVMSTHGLTGIQRWMMGSVADRVVRHASVPVLLVRVPKNDKIES